MSDVPMMKKKWSKTEEEEETKDEFLLELIVGLGNYGDEFECTWHNVGKDAVEYIAEQLGVEMKYDKKANGYTGQSNGLRFYVPKGFMNTLGQIT